MARDKRRPKTAAKVERAGDLAERAMRSMVPSEQIRLARIQLAWGAAVPPHVQRVAWPASVRGDTLVLHVVDNQWLHELSYLRSDLLARLRAAGIDGLSDLRPRVGKVDELPPPPPPPVLPEPPLDAEPERETIAAMSAVEDPGLRDVIAKARLALGRR
jgi:hypothetical protein